MKHIICNYKMQLGVRESVALARGVLRGIQGQDVVPAIVVCPSFPALAEVRKVLVRSHVELGAQNVAAEAPGALTGEVAAAQLADIGCEYVIVGHSERRARLNETDTMVHAKLEQTLATTMTPILCVGEDAAQRAAGKAEDVVERQLTQAFQGLLWPRRRRAIVAYEPVWAIGSGTPATPADCIAMHRTIRHVAHGLLGVPAEDIVVLYGGSVDGHNAYTLLRERNIDGVLLGGASTKLHECLAVITAAREVMEAQRV